MPTDIPSTVYDAVFSRIQSGITNYNAAITGNTLTGCQPVALNDLLDDRADGRQRAKVAGKAPADFPQVRLSSAGGGQEKNASPTFGACDAIVPRTVTLILTIMHDTVTNASQTPLETYIDAAIHAGYPKLGISYCRGFSFSDQRKDEQIGKVQRTVRRRTITVDLWPHLVAVQ